MKKVLITGAGGFVGSHTVKAALRDSDWEVHAVVSGRHRHIFPPKIIVHTLDLFESGSCEELIKDARPDILIHLAWSLDESGYSASDSNLLWVESSLRLLRMFYRYGGHRFLFVGSASEYGELSGRSSEYALSVQRSVYGESKLAFEMICKRFCERNSYEFVSVRCFPVYGEGDGREFKAVGAAIAAFLRGEHFVCKGPNNVWDYVYVEDAANALVRIAQSQYCGIVNVGTGRPHLMRDVFMQIAEKMDSQTLLSFGDDLEHITISVADPTILDQEIGYRCQINFSEGLDRTIAWWKTHNNNTFGGKKV